MIRILSGRNDDNESDINFSVYSIYDRKDMFEIVGTKLNLRLIFVPIKKFML